MCQKLLVPWLDYIRHFIDGGFPWLYVSLVKPREVNCDPNDQKLTFVFCMFFLKGFLNDWLPKNWCSLDYEKLWMPNMQNLSGCWQPWQTKIGHKRDPFKIETKTARHPGGDQGLASWGRGRSIPRNMIPIFVVLPRFWASLQYCYLVLSANDLRIVVKLSPSILTSIDPAKRVRVGASIKVLGTKWVHKIHFILWCRNPLS